VDVATGHVSCRVQFHARIHNKFDLRSFPFDCQRLQVELELQGCPGRFLVGGRCGSIDQNGNLDGWTLRATSLDVDGGGLPPRRARVSMLVERSSRYYLVQVIAIFACLATLVFSFYVVEAQFLDKRIVDALKIVLTMTTFRFSVEHRLPRVQHWTPFDIYHVSCQVLCTCIIVSFIVAKLGDKDGMRHCQTREKEVYVIAFLSCAWVAWHICCGIHSLRLKGRDLRHLARPSELRRTRAHLSQQSSAHPVVEAEVPSAPARQLAALPREAADGSGLGTLAAPGGHLGVARPRDSAFGQSVQETQVISIAFRIWLVRNVDLVTGTFECKFRVFLEWVDVNAVGRPKGQKAKLPVPDITITNAIQSQLLDASSAPEVVNPDTGHLAAQKLYKCTMRMDQEVRHFPFDWQWLAITVSMRDEGEFNRPFFFQYCEMEGQLQLDEWHVHDQPAFTTLSKHDAPSSEDTVMCGILIRRQPRYYVVNILFMLGLITSLCFSIYSLPVTLFWERAEVFLGIFPLIVIFKMSAQGKLPRGGSSTQFDRYAQACTHLFLLIVFEAMLASLAVIAPTWAICSETPLAGLDGDLVQFVSIMEKWFWWALCLLWIGWNVRFAAQAWRVRQLGPLQALGSRVPIRLQDEEWIAGCSAADPDCGGLAPGLCEQAASERVTSSSFVSKLGRLSDKTGA